MLLTLLLVSCSGGADQAQSADATDGSLTTSSDETTPDRLPFDAAADDAPPLRLALKEPASFDPLLLELDDQAAVIAIDLLYDGLTEAGADGELRPALAESWTATDDFTVWTFELDGARIDAEAVVVYVGALLGAADDPVAAALDGVVGVRAEGATRVVFDLAEPASGFPWLLSGVSFSIPGVDGAPTGRYLPLPSGDTGGEGMMLEPLDGNGRAIAVSWADSDADAYEKLTLGLVDAAVAPRVSLADAESRFGAAAPARGAATYVRPNPRSPRVVSPAVRAAVRLAVDRDSIVDLALVNTAYSVDGVLAPTLVGYRYSGCGPACRLDDVEAGRLVADEVDPGPIELTVGIDGDDDRAVADALVDDLRGVGFEATVVRYEDGGLEAALADGTVDLFIETWHPLADSVDAFAARSWPSVDPDAALAFGEVLATAAATGPDDARWELLNQAHEAMLIDGDLVPLAVERGRLILAPGTSGISVGPDGSIDLLGEE